MITSNFQMNNIALYHFRVSILINGALIIIWFGCGGLITSIMWQRKNTTTPGGDTGYNFIHHTTNKNKFHNTKAILIHRDNLLESGHTVVAILTHAHEASI